MLRQSPGAGNRLHRQALHGRARGAAPSGAPGRAPGDTMAHAPYSWGDGGAMTKNAGRGFPLPSSVKVVPGTERAQAAYPYYMQFAPEDDQRFWFYNSMHFPEPMCAFDSVTGEAAYCALGAANT